MCLIRLYARSRGCTFVCACRHAHESANGAANTTADGRAHDQAADDRPAVLCADAHADAHAEHASDCHADRPANKLPIAHSDELIVPTSRTSAAPTNVPTAAACVPANTTELPINSSDCTKSCDPPSPPQRHCCWQWPFARHHQ